MKVAVVANDMTSLVNFRGVLLQELVARGHTVLTLVPAGDAKALQQLRAWHVDVRHIPMSRAGLNPMREWVTLRALHRLFANLQPDVVLSYTIKPVLWGCLAAKRAHVPRVYSMITGLGYAFMGGKSLKQRLVYLAARWLYRCALPRTDAVFFQNPDDEAVFRSLRLLPDSVRNVLINGSGVDLDRFSPQPLPDAPIFLLMARLIADKGIREYRQAAVQIKRQIPEARFLLAGGLDENPTAISQSELERWKADGSIEYLGSLSDVRAALAGCSVYVLPSYREGTPRSTLEALATGRAVITTDAPGCRETVQDGVNGLIVPVKDVDALAGAMIKLARDADLRGLMGAASLRLARDKYDVHKVNQVILETMGL